MHPCSPLDLGERKQFIVTNEKTDIYDADVAQHSAQDGEKGDLWIQEPIHSCKGLIADFRLTHPVVGVASKSAPLGKVQSKPKAVVAEAREKRNKHAQPY